MHNCIYICLVMFVCVCVKRVRYVVAYIICVCVCNAVWFLHSTIPILRVIGHRKSVRVVVIPSLSLSLYTAIGWVGLASDCVMLLTSGIYTGEMCDQVTRFNCLLTRRMMCVCVLLNPLSRHQLLIWHVRGKCHIQSANSHNRIPSCIELYQWAFGRSSASI